MKKPNNYDETQVGGDYTPIELGGHTAKIMKVEETTSKTGRPMIKVGIDFDSKDVQPGYFKESFDNDTRSDKKWPYQGTQYILSEDNEGKCSKSFKGFISAVEDSNNASCLWDDTFEKWFKNKKIGVVYGEVEEEYNGEVKTRRRIRYFCSYDKAKTAAIPDKKFLDNVAPKPADESKKNDGFMNVPESIDEDIPF